MNVEGKDIHRCRVSHNIKDHLLRPFRGSHSLKSSTFNCYCNNLQCVTTLLLMVVFVTVKEPLWTLMAHYRRIARKWVEVLVVASPTLNVGVPLFFGTFVNLLDLGKLFISHNLITHLYLQHKCSCVLNLLLFVYNYYLHYVNSFMRSADMLLISKLDHVLSWSCLQELCSEDHLSVSF